MRYVSDDRDPGVRHVISRPQQLKYVHPSGEQISYKEGPVNAVVAISLASDSPAMPPLRTAPHSLVRSSRTGVPRSVQRAPVLVLGPRREGSPPDEMTLISPAYIALARAQRHDAVAKMVQKETERVYEWDAVTNGLQEFFW